MEISLNIKGLTDALATVKPWSNSKNEDTNCVLIEIGDGICRLRSSSAIGCAKIDFAADGELSAKVDIQKFHAVLQRLGAQDAVKLRVDAANLVVSSGRTRVSLPRYESRTFVPPMYQVQGRCTVSRDEWLDRAGRVAWLNLPTETQMIQAARIVVDNGKLYSIASTSHSWACAEMDFTGDVIDTAIAHDGMSALKASLRKLSSDTMTLLPQESQCTVQSGDFECTIKGTTGRLPLLMTQVRGHMQGSKDWLIEQDDILEILGTARIFLTEQATGIWLLPKEDGLHIAFTGEADGTLEQDLAAQGRCTSIAPGAVEGEETYMSHRMLEPMVRQADSSNFKMSSFPGRVGVESDGYYAVSAAMAAPKRKVSV